ncbi:unnamed protein product [Lota lota]
MMSPDPLKSAISIGMVDDTSLAVPSVNQYRSGQQRVMEQVQTLKRTKSKHSTRNGTGTLSPTSPTFDSMFTYAHKSLPISVNGSSPTGNGLSKRVSSEKNVNRPTLRTARGSGQWAAVQSSHNISRGYNTAAGPLGRANTSRSEPDLGRRLARPKQAAPPQRLLSNRSSYQANGQCHYQANGQYQTQATPQFFMNGTSKTKRNSQFIPGQARYGQTVVDSGAKAKVDSGFNGSGVPGDITMREAVACLSSADQQLQHCGASFIQHSTFLEDKAKQEVQQLSGIPPLVALLRSPSPQIRLTVSAALRNLSFKDTTNKEELHRCGGVEEAVALLRETDSADIHKQLTGLLWNMSSVESLRPDLVKLALPALMEKVVLPYTTGPDRTSNTDPEVFYHATGCLRNFSSGKQSIRQSMRKCRGLVDSLVGYVEACVEAQRPDDKSVENCACVLHNLTFQLEAEAPTLFSRMSALGRASSAPEGDTGPIGCFSPQSSKVLEAERHFDYPTVEDQNPTGAGWLIHSKTLQSYLGLLSSSQKDNTLEACCGALQNLTANPGIVSNVISQTVVKKLSGLSVIAPLLGSPKVNLQKNTVALVANLAKNPHLSNPIARKTLPQLFAILAAGAEPGAEGGAESDDTLSMACQTAHVLTMKEQDMGRPLLTKDLIQALNRLSENSHFPKSSKAASLLLHGLWSDKDMQGALKKKGMSKTSFVTKESIAAHRSVQVVE